MTPPPDSAGWRPVLHPAGTDSALASVLGDVAAGRWLGMAELLAAPESADRGVRCTRTLLLARIAAGTDAVEEWLAEHPRAIDAHAMRSRVAVERACAAIVAPGSQRREGADHVHRAEAACQAASSLDPADPVPHLGLLALACARQVFTDGPSGCPVPGPWKEFADVWRIDPGNREAVHRMLAAVTASGAGDRAPDGQMFARWIAAFPEIGPASPVNVLPLYSLVGLWEHRNRTPRAGELPHLLWTTDSAFADIQLAWTWFCRADPATRLVLDLSHLAHALWAAQRPDSAAEVFEALGAYGALRPWGQVAGDGVAELVRARTQSLLARARTWDSPG